MGLVNGQSVWPIILVPHLICRKATELVLDRRIRRPTTLNEHLLYIFLGGSSDFLTKPHCSQLQMHSPVIYQYCHYSMGK